MMKRLDLIMICYLFLIQAVFAYPGKVIHSWPLHSKAPTGLAYDGRYLWYADHQTDKLVSLNPQNGEKIKEISSPGFWPMGLAWDGQTLWNLDGNDRKIYQIDPKNGTILKSIDAPGNKPEGLTWDGHTLWITDARGKEIMMLDLSDGTAVRKFAAPANYPQGLTFDGKYLWCSDRMSDEIYMLEPENGDVILMTKSPGPYPRGLAFDGHSIWHVDYQTDSLYQMVRQDEEKYLLSDSRKSRMTFTHEVKCSGPGTIQTLDVFLALPENLPQQKIISMQLNPYQWDEVQDKWDQWFAHFHSENLGPTDAAVCSLIVECEISAINYFIFPDQVGSLKDIPKEIQKQYTADGSKYDIQNPYMIELSKEIVGDETNPYWMARRIYDFVGANMEYKLEGGWNTAPMVLQRGTGSCSEYSFAFIALCRAAGIPARYVGALVVRGDDASLDDVFHRWPEIYLPGYGWIPMDAQGGDKPLPRDHAKSIGQLPNRFLITTHGGGDSRYMGWYYNAYETYVTDPKVKVHIENFGEWEPIK